MKEFKVKKYCELCDQYEDLDREELKEKIEKIIEELEDKEDNEVFNTKNSNSILMKIPMFIARDTLKNEILDMLYGKEEK